DSRNGAQRQAGATRLVFGLRLAAHLEVPPGEPRGQAHVLTLLADGERELIVGCYDLHRMRVLVHDDLGNARRRHGADDELGRIGRPVHDVDLLATQLLHDALDAGALHADARANRVDVLIVGAPRDLGPPAGLARRALHFDDALVDLRHLLLEQLDEEAGMRPREHDLRALAAHLDVEDEGADAVALPIALA